MSTPSSMVGEQKRIGRLPVRKRALPLLAVLVGHLGRVLSCLESDELVAGGSVEVDEEGIRATATLGLVGNADRVVERPGRVAGLPTHGGGNDLVARHVVFAAWLGHPVDKTSDAEILKDLLDDMPGMLHGETTVCAGLGELAPEVLSVAATGRHVGLAQVVVLAPRSGKRRAACSSFSSSSIAQGLASRWLLWC